jgi:hypothetical protein
LTRAWALTREVVTESAKADQADALHSITHSKGLYFFRRITNRQQEDREYPREYRGAPLSINNSLEMTLSLSLSLSLSLTNLITKKKALKPDSPACNLK